MIFAVVFGTFWSLDFLSCFLYGPGKGHDLCCFWGQSIGLRRMMISSGSEIFWIQFVFNRDMVNFPHFLMRNDNSKINELLF
jgi:hypothetical protein